MITRLLFVLIPFFLGIVLGLNLISLPISFLQAAFGVACYTIVPFGFAMLVAHWCKTKAGCGAFFGSGLSFVAGALITLGTEYGFFIEVVGGAWFAWSVYAVFTSFALIEPAPVLVREARE